MNKSFHFYVWLCKSLQIKEKKAIKVVKSDIRNKLVYIGL